MGGIKDTKEYPPNGNGAHATKAVDPSEKQVEEAINKSVVTDLPPFWGNRLWTGGGYEWTLPGVEAIERQAYLGRMRYHPQAIVFQAAAFALISQFISSSYEIVGNRRVDFFSDVLMNADRGMGWDNFWQRVWWDFLTLDDGAVIEVIGGGAPDSALQSREQVVGIGYLDPLRCYFTGNHDYPVWYQDYYGKMHKMHTTRVIRLVDMPLPYQSAFGRGFCALSRVISAIQQSITMMTYTGEMLSDSPPPAMFNAGKVLNQTALEQSYLQYQAARRSAGNSIYKPIWWNTQIGDKMDAELIPFSVAPAGYDFEKYIRLLAQMTAAGIGMDPNDILPLVSGNFGTGTESVVLDKKAHGKMIAVMFKLVTRTVNRRVLPRHLEYKSKHQDDEQSAAEVDRARTQLEIAEKMQTVGIPQEAIHLYVANTVPAFKDVLLDENGDIRLYDSDPKPDAPLQPPMMVAEVAEVVPQTNDDIQADPQEPTDEVVDDTEKAYTVKAYEDIRYRFVSALEDTLTGANDADFNRRRAGTIIRALIAKDGREAYKEGLLQGGVEVDVLEGDDLDAYNRLVTEASGYVSNLTEKIYTQGLSPDQIRLSADAWSNKTLQKFYYWGVESGDKNGAYVWKLGATEEHCRDCARLNGQIHRFKDWRESGWMPGADRLECGGYQCQCKLVKTKGRVRGKL